MRKTFRKCMLCNNFYKSRSVQVFCTTRRRTSNFLNLYVSLMFSSIVYIDVMNIKVLSEYGKGLQDTGTIHTNALNYRLHCTLY